MLGITPTAWKQVLLLIALPSPASTSVPQQWHPVLKAGHANGMLRLCLTLKLTAEVCAAGFAQLLAQRNLTSQLARDAGRHEVRQRASTGASIQLVLTNFTMPPPGMITRKDYTLLKDDQQDDQSDDGQEDKRKKKPSSNVWRLLGLAKEEIPVRMMMWLCFGPPTLGGSRM